MLSKVVSSSIFKVFGMTRPGIEPRSPGPLANTLTAGPMSHIYIYIYIYIYINFIKNNRHFMSTYFLLDPFEFPYYYSGGIDLCIVHSCIYPYYFLPDLGPSSGEDLLQKWCNFCFSILSLCKSVFTVEDYGVCF